MKPIKIVESNQAAIEAALQAVNGNCLTSTYTDYVEIDALATRAEEELASLELPQAERAGAAWQQTSGCAVANAYKYPRDATRVVLTRRPTGWFLTGVSRVQIGTRGGGGGRLMLTLAQADEAVRRFKQHFDVGVY